MRATSSGSISSKISKPDRAPGRLEAGLHAGVADRDALHAEAGADAVVLDEQAVGVGDEHLPAGVGVGRAHLADRVALGPGRVVGALEHLGLAGLADRLRQLTHVVRPRHRAPFERHDPGLAGLAAGGGRRGLRGVAEPGLGEVGGVGVAGGVTTDDADTGAALTTRREFLDLAVVEPRRRHPSVFREHLGEVATVTQRRLERALKNCLFDQVCLLRGCLS